MTASPDDAVILKTLVDMRLLNGEAATVGAPSPVAPSKNAQWHEFPFPVPGVSPRLVFFDLETTGRTIHSRVVQFGALVVDAVTLAPIGSGHSWLIHADGLTPEATALHHITPKDIADKPDFAGVANNIFGVLDGAVWLGYNIIRFDIPILEHEFQLIGRPMPKSAAVVDVFAIASQWNMRAYTGNLRLDTLCKFYGLGDERHDALDDSIKAYEVLVRMISGRGIARLALNGGGGAGDGHVVTAGATRTPALSAVTPKLRAKALERREVLHITTVTDMRRARETTSVNPQTWPAGVFVGGDEARQIFHLARELTTAPDEALVTIAGGRHKTIRVAVHCGYKKADGNVLVYVLAPIRLEPRVVHVEDLLRPAFPRQQPFKTFLYDRFIWTKLALIVDNV